MDQWWLQEEIMGLAMEDYEMTMTDDEGVHLSMLRTEYIIIKFYPLHSYFYILTDQVKQ